MSIYARIIEAEQNETPLTATGALKAWGAAMRDNDGDLSHIDGAWPDSTIEYRLMRLGHGAKEPGGKLFMTAPESAVDRMRYRQDVALWVNPIIRAQPMTRFMVAMHIFAHGFSVEGIAEQIGATSAEVLAHKWAIVSAIKRAIARVKKETAMAA